MAFHRQLTGLLSDGAELTEAGLRPSPVSFEGLIEFLRLNPAIAHPNLALDKKGDFIASWSPHRLAKLSITFADLQSARWVAADRSPGSRGRGCVAWIRGAGAMTPTPFRVRRCGRSSGVPAPACG